MKVNKSLAAKAKKQEREINYARRMKSIVDNSKVGSKTYSATKDGTIIARGLSIFDCARLGFGFSFIAEG